MYTPSSHCLPSMNSCRTMQCLGATVLLAATFLASAGSEKVTTCDGNHIHRLTCDDGVIMVKTAMYGRADTVTCSERRAPGEIANRECSLAGVLEIMKTRCNGKKVCEMIANEFAGNDPCRGTYKYLETTYDCMPAIHQVACEHSLVYLGCDEEQTIVVYGADYGRRDHTTCALRRPTAQTQNADCSTPTTKVAESCNGQNSCTIRAENQVFGDPCAGTYKYLEVSYTCQYPST